MSVAKETGGHGVGLAVRRWVDSWAGIDEPRENQGPAAKRVDWPRILPFALLHLACLAALWTGWSPIAVGVAIGLYFVRMFAITAFYHRYFSHRTFRTSRALQFVFAALGNSSVQRGPLWWAAHHREHHQNSDTEEDPHSPTRHGLFWSHIGWVTAKDNFLTRRERVRDLLRYPELCFLDRFDIVVPLLMFGALYGFGALLAAFWPELGTSGGQMLVWGVISTVVLFHATFTINSLAHVWGTRSYETRDTSRNNALLALITLGEGWHNNHHHYQGSVRQGFQWWELDISYLVLRAMEKLGLVWQLNPVPQAVLDRLGQDKRG
jgi:stearoyl-CoA desaturase (delta-9 desaturase)